MTPRTTDTPEARHSGGGVSPIVPWLLVPLVALLGGVAMVLQAVPLEDETLRGLAATPDLWAMRLRAALNGVAPSWIRVTLDGLVMGMVVFLMASGLTLVIGLMGLVGFMHGALVAIGAFVAVIALARLGGGTASIAFVPDLASIGAAAPVAMVGAAAPLAMVVAVVLAALFRRVNLRRGGGLVFMQIVVTVGTLIIAERVLPMIWGPTEIAAERPAALDGIVTFLWAALDIRWLLPLGVGLAAVALLALVSRHTRTGLVLRAAMQDREMVQALGYPLRAIGVGVFIASAALTAVGVMLWALHVNVVTAQTGADVMALVVATVVIGGLGSVTGCFLAALVIGLVHGYTAFFDPDLVILSAMAVLVAVLVWRPAGILARRQARP